MRVEDRGFAALVGAADTVSASSDGSLKVLLSVGGLAALLAIYGTWADRKSRSTREGTRDHQYDPDFYQRRATQDKMSPGREMAERSRTLIARELEPLGYKVELWTWDPSSGRANITVAKGRKHVANITRTTGSDRVEVETSKSKSIMPLEGVPELLSFVEER